MTHTSRKSRALSLTIAAMAAGSVISSQHALAAPAAKSVTYKGSTVDERWGTVQVSVVVKNKKITNVKAAYSVDTSRSELITSNALPQLKQEVLQAQNANVQLVSGATDLSQAYVTSLQSAVKKAHKSKAL
jgi:uncharacterized protein with FMN-binding domain